MLRKLKLASRLQLLVAIFALGFAVYGIFSIVLFERFRAGGPLGQQFALKGSLRADIQPSSLYIVESYLVCLQIVAAASSDRPLLIKKLNLYRAQYLAHRASWQASQLDPQIKTALQGAVNSTALQFYDAAFGELLPALAARDRAAERAALRTMQGLFELHRHALDAIVAAVLEGDAALVAHTSAQVDFGELILFCTLLVFLLLLVAFASRIQCSIVVPLAEAVAMARRIASGENAGTIVCSHHDEAGQLLAALNDMSDSLRARLAERNRSNAEASSALALLEQLVETANVMVIGLDAAGAITIFNAMAEAVSGYPRAAVIGKKWTDVTLLAHPQSWQLALGTAAAHDMPGSVPSSVQQELICSSGAVRTIDWKNSVLDPSTAHGVAIISVGIDVTEQLLTDQALRDAKQTAERANRGKSEFLANMSHEIRTPMNAVLGMTALALRTELTAQQRNYLEKSQGAAQGLLGIIDDILDYSKIEAGKLHFESRRFRIADVVAKMSALVAYKAHEKGLELVFDVDGDVPARLVGDEMRLGQVLLNLLNNAIKFTVEGRVRLQIAVVAVGASQVGLRFTVEDSGIGISDQQRAKLFVAFEQADTSTTRHHGGTGLGLTISKSLVEMMHGKIWAGKAYPNGSRFIFTAQFETAVDVPAEKRAARDFVLVRALVITDDDATFDAITASLDNFHIDVARAADGFAGVKAMQDAKRHGEGFQLVLLDWDAASTEGVETVRRIRAHPALANIPVIVLVASHRYDAVAAQQRALHLDGVLEKPFDAGRVLNIISRAIDQTPGEELPALPQEYDQLVAAVSGARILLVEDNEVNREFALEVLSSAGLQVDLACNGAQAVTMVKCHTYDAVIMDWQMPVMDGIEATRTIRSDARYRDLPIIAMTANAMAGDREACLAAGMNDHIAKPIDIDELVMTLARWVRPQRAGAAPSAPAPAPVAFPALAGVDTHAMHRRLHGNVQSFWQLAALFAWNQTDTAASLRAMLEARDIDGAVRLLQQLQQMAADLGAGQLAGAAANLEQSLRAPGSLAALMPDLDSISTMLAMLLAQISSAYLDDFISEIG